MMESADEIRPEAVQGMMDAVLDLDLTALAGLTHISPAERATADQAILDVLVARAPDRDRLREVWGIVLKRQWASPPSWDQLWAELDHGDVEALLERYDVLPEGLRHRVDAYRARTSEP